MYHIHADPAIQQPQASATARPQVDVHPQPPMFSEDMSYDQVAAWLTNHPQLVGGYQRDIRKLRGTH